MVSATCSQISLCNKWTDAGRNVKDDERTDEADRQQGSFDKITTKLRCSLPCTTIVMDFGEIPDDIWISIFEQINDLSILAILVRTCRRFHGLASKLLLRELKWIKPELTLRNIEAWGGVYSTVLALPRKITIGVPFEFTHAMRQSISHVRFDCRPTRLIYDLSRL